MLPETSLGYGRLLFHLGVVMSVARTIARILLGVAWVFFGLNGFFHFFTPPPMAGDAGTFFTGMMASGYIFPVISAVEIIAGLMFLANRFVALGLLLLAPILMNILAFHLMLDLKGIGMGLLFTVLALFLAWCERSAFAGVLSPTVPAQTA